MLLKDDCKIRWKAEDVVKVVRDSDCVSRCLYIVVYGDQERYLLVKRIIDNDLALAAIVYGFRITLVNEKGNVEDVFQPRCENPLTIYILQYDDGHIDLLTNINDKAMPETVTGTFTGTFIGTFTGTFTGIFIPDYGSTSCENLRKRSFDSIGSADSDGSAGSDAVGKIMI